MVDWNSLVPAIENIIKAILVIIVGIIAGRLTYWIIKRWAVRFAGVPTAKTLGKFMQWMIIFLFLVISFLVMFGVNPQIIALISGAIAFAITFGFQNVIQNIVGGLLIAVDGRVQVGDWMEVGDTPLQTGPAEVMDIGLTSITVREKYGRIYVIPSSYLTMHKVVNYSETGCFNVRVPITLPWNDDPEKVRVMLLEEARTVPLVYPNVTPIHREPRIKKRAWRKKKQEVVDMDLQNIRFMPSVSFVKTDKDSITYDVSIWTDVPMNASTATSDFISRATRRLRKEGVKEAPILCK